jgi:hypothetical protein
MLGLDLGPGEDQLARIERGISQALHAATASNHRVAVETLLNTIGVQCGPADDNYYREALDYYLGLAYARTKQPSLVIDHIHRSRVLPSGGSSQIFEIHKAEAEVLNDRMMAARERGLPTFFLASMPRSASASFTQSIARLLDMPVVRLSVGHTLPHYVLIPRWLNHVSPGGAVLHDHFSPNDINAETLRQAGIKKIMVLVRDPRAAAFSLLSLSATIAQQQAQALQALTMHFIPWLRQWQAAARTGEFEIKWISSATMRNDPGSIWREIVEEHVGLYPALKPYLEKALELPRANYGHGDDQRWRQAVDEAVLQKIWDAIPADIADAFELRP